ncbi:suppressor of fused domain protein [Actinoallomurus iriomotensis]|uniref:Suppressor of fused-like domain-containing protein n=1 Tax=Actinoallomurus iriomotensis TaxID=478107 RepID=A0A9W6RTK5_9ACTN|nr:suppressor of fused domain protein [Actinoallomurus iriomotensis]GLY81616.1 hypothetical protein Airi01_098830 [Actinoallomurus iriomotensis]
MSYPHADPRRYEGLLAHAERHLGPVVRGEGPTIDGRNRGFSIGFHEHPSYAMVSVATTGVRFQKVTGPCPGEFVVSARPGQEQEAAYLLHVVADRAVRSGKGYEYGGGYVNAEPLIPGTAIEFLLASPHPYVDEAFDLFYDDDELALRYITLIPATRAEFELVREHGDDEALRDLWESRATDLLDVYRTSAV